MLIEIWILNYILELRNMSKKTRIEIVPNRLPNYFEHFQPDDMSKQHKERVSSFKPEKFFRDGRLPEQVLADLTPHLLGAEYVIIISGEHNEVKYRPSDRRIYGFHQNWPFYRLTLQSRDDLLSERRLKREPA